LGQPTPPGSQPSRGAARGAPRRITETERGRIIQLAQCEPPGRLVQGDDGLLAPADPEAPAVWTLDALTGAAWAAGSRRAAARSVRS
jgi:hypothetical protein